MLSLHTNTASLSALSSLGRTEGRMAHAMTRLGTGYRVNSAMDDAAGLQIATRLSAQSHGMAAAMGNIQKSLSMLQTAEGALGESGNMLVRMKDLAIQAADASATAADRSALQAEYTALSHELSHVSSGTTFGGARLLLGDTTAEKANVVAASAAAAAASGAAGAALATAQNNHNNALAADQAGSTAATRAALAAAAGAIVGASANAGLASAAALDAQQYANAVAAVTAVDGVFSKAVDFQIGASGKEVMTVRLTAQLDAMHAALHAAASTYDTFGIDRPGAGTDLLIASAASASIDKLQGAIDAVAGVRASLGASANRLGHADNNLANMRGNTSAAMGRIMDTDFAQASADMVSSQMLLQAGGSVLRQTNSISSMVMSLLG